MRTGILRSTGPKYRIITDELRKKIICGEYAPGETLPSQRALVAEYQVSLSTVRQSLGELTREGVVRAEPGRGFFVEQVDGALARGRRQRGEQIGFACWASSDHEPAYMMMVNGASREAQAMGETIHYIYVSPEDSGSIERCVELAPNLSGIIVCGMANSENLQCGLLDGSKVVILGELPDDKDCEPFNWVTTNADAAAYLAVQILLVAGHERIGLVTRQVMTDYYRKLEEGFHAACRTGNVLESPIFFVEEDIADDWRAIADEMVRGSSVTGLVVIDDGRAARMAVYMREGGLRVPQDVSIVGVGGLPRETLAVPDLSRVNIRYQQLGEEAVRLLLKHPSETVTHKSLPPHVDHGKTVAPPRVSSGDGASR